MNVNWDDYKEFAKRTCANCGTRAPQPFMHKKVVEIEVAKGKSALSLRTVLGSLLGNKRSARQLSGFLWAPSKRTYSRRKTIYLCEACADKKTAETLRLERGENKGSCLTTVILLLVGVAMVLRFGGLIPKDDQIVEFVQGDARQQETSGSTSPPGDGQSFSESNLHDESDASLIEQHNVRTMLRFRIELKECYIRQELGGNKMSLFNKRPKTERVFLIAEWRYSILPGDSTAGAHLPELAFVNTSGERTRPSTLAERKLRWERDRDTSTEEHVFSDSKDMFSVFEIKRSAFDADSCRIAFKDQDEEALIPINSSYSSN